MAAALFMRPRPYEFAHDSIQMPFSPSFLLTLNHLSKFDQEVHVFLVLLFVPVRGREFLLRWQAVLQTVDHLFRAEDPGLKFAEVGVEGWEFGVGVGGLGGKGSGTITHSGCLIILLKGKVLLTFEAVQKGGGRWGVRGHGRAGEDKADREWGLWDLREGPFRVYWGREDRWTAGKRLGIQKGRGQE